MTIYICGVPRAGKTTLAKKLKEKINNSNLIVSEAIRNAFQKIDVVNATKWGQKNSSLRQKVFPEFIKEFLNWNEKFSNNINILDCSLISLENIISLADKKDIIICLGFGGKENKYILDVIRKYENENDYTKNLSNEYLLKLWGDLSTIDIENQKICAQFNVKYFDTSKFRQKFQDKIIDYVINNLNL